jgi:hypothetical protein
MGPLGCPETSVQNYLSALHNILEGRRSDLHRGGSLKSRSEIHRHIPEYSPPHLANIIVCLIYDGELACHGISDS